MNAIAASAKNLSACLPKVFCSLVRSCWPVAYQGCNVMPPQALTHSPQFEPVYPLKQVQASTATGAIYIGRQSDSWFGKGRNFQVGDVITVLLNESTQAARSQVGSISRNSTNDMLSPGLAVLGNKLGGVMKGTDFSKTDISNKGTGTADQTASLNRLCGCFCGRSHAQRQLGIAR
jgi:flagellar L-ring protein FlgH